MVKAGKPVDGVIADLVPLLDAGGHHHRRGQLAYFDTAPARGEVREPGSASSAPASPGAKRGRCKGPASCPAARARPTAGERASAHRRAGGREPCCAYIGADGAGHYVKMVHNGIEYADMQLIAEAYDLLRCSG